MTNLPTNQPASDFPMDQDPHSGPVVVNHTPPPTTDDGSQVIDAQLPPVPQEALVGVDAALANKKTIANTNITITSAKTDIDGISNALSNTATRITTAISLIVSRTNTVIMNSSNTTIKSILLKNVFTVAKISKDVTMTANNLLNTLGKLFLFKYRVPFGI
jgi:hypothetical protein